MYICNYCIFLMNWPLYHYMMTFFVSSLLVQIVKNLPATQRHRLSPWFMKIPWRREWQPTPAFLPGESHGQRMVVSHGGLPSLRSQTDTTEWLTLSLFLHICNCIFLMSWSFYHYMILSLPPVIIFYSKYILFDINIVIPILFWFPFAWNNFSIHSLSV